MFVSGITIQSKKASVSRKSQLPRGDECRPSSTELPQLPQLRARTINKFSSAAQKPEKGRNSSHNKIFTSSKAHHKQEEPLREYNTENRIARPNKPAVQPRRSKKLELSKEQPELCLFANEDRLTAYFRYYPVAVVAAAGLREEMMRGLSDRGDVPVAGAKGKRGGRKGVAELWAKLTKLAMLKGKYKFREKFNFMANAQLKALAYKRKEAKRKKESSSSSSEEEPERREKCRDLQTWKKSMGVQGSKVFIVKGKYKDLRGALLQRGWVQNEDPCSLFYDLKWTTKVNDVNFDTLKPHQLVNHFNNNACLTSKYGICKSLRSIMFAEAIQVDAFFPKAFDISDISDFENFLEVYKWTYCESKLKKAREDPQPPPSEEQLRAKVAFVVTSRRLLAAEKTMVSLVNGKFNVCSMGEWRFVSGGKECGAQVQEALQQWQVRGLEWQGFREAVGVLLGRLQKKDPQVRLNGSNNIWIVKPAFLSRGRGIKCLSELTDILDYSLGKETQYVVQKYIENPLILRKRKFDIRQWVLVEDYNPPRIWFYGEFYCRFCLEDYNPSKLTNKYAHLTNNSIQKYNSKIDQEQLQNDSMCTMEQLAAIIEQLAGPAAFKELLARMKEIVVATILSTADQVYGRRGSFELIGYDFMIDEAMNPWLIEINSSPSMDYSTPVTRRLVKMVLEDTVKVIVDLRKKKSKKKTAGLFKCIYDAESGYEFKRYRMPEEQ